MASFFNANIQNKSLKIMKYVKVITARHMYNLPVAVAQLQSNILCVSK